MSKLAISTLFIVASAVAVQGSLFGPFGPFGQPANLPAFGPQGGGPFFPGFFYQQGPPAGLVPVLNSPVASRALVAPVPAALPAGPGLFRPKPSPVLQRLLLKLLPEDLQERLNQLLVTYDEGNAACDALNTGYAFVGAYRRCVVFNKIAVEQAATALEKEADERAAAEQAAAEQAAAEQAAAEQAAAEQAAAEQAAAEQAAAEQAAAEQAAAEQAAAQEDDQAVVEEETVVADEAEVDVAEVADSTGDVEEPTVEVEVDAEAENVDVEESSTVV